MADGLRRGAEPMDDSERRALTNRFLRVMRAIYLTSLTAANVCAAHGRLHLGETRSRLEAHAAELRDRQVEAARLLELFGRGRPMLRWMIGPLTSLWGRLTTLTGRRFSLHMLVNMEAQGARLTTYAQNLARELAHVAAVEALVRLQRAEDARKKYIISQLELAQDADEALK